MARYLFSQVKSQLARFAGAGFQPDDSRVKDRLNLATQTLMIEGDFVGLTAQYQFCSEGTDCITLPAELDTLLGYRIDAGSQTGNSPGYCSVIGNIRSTYFKFNQDARWMGCGSGCAATGNNQFAKGFVENAIDEGYSTTFRDICTPSYIRVYADLPEASGAQVLVKGFSDLGNEVFTNAGGNWVNGEYININNATPQTSVNIFQGALLSLTKPITNGLIRIYAVNAADTSIQSLIAVLGSWETNSQYRRYRIPGLSSILPGQTVPIKTICRRAFRPIVSDWDQLLIGNLRALDLELKSIQFYDADLDQKGATYHQAALQQLYKEMSSYYGKALKTSLIIQRQGFMNSRPGLV